MLWRYVRKHEFILLSGGSQYSKTAWSNRPTLWEVTDYGEYKMKSSYRDYSEQGVGDRKSRRFLGPWSCSVMNHSDRHMLLYICLHPNRDPSVNYGSGVAMVCEHRFIYSNKQTTSGERVMERLGLENDKMWDFSYFYSSLLWPARPHAVHFWNGRGRLNQDWHRKATSGNCVWNVSHWAWAQKLKKKMRHPKQRSERWGELYTSSEHVLKAHMRPSCWRYWSTKTETPLL